jgi:DNA-directed RNA polymerase subunit RPC12/RpoP
VSDVHFECTSCGKQLKVPQAHAGKRCQCPTCSAVVSIPEDTLKVLPEDAWEQRVQLADSDSARARNLQYIAETDDWEGFRTDSEYRTGPRCGRCGEEVASSESARVEDAPRGMNMTWCTNCIRAVRSGAFAFLPGVSLDDGGKILHLLPGQKTWAEQQAERTDHGVPSGIGAESEKVDERADAAFKGWCAGVGVAVAVGYGLHVMSSVGLLPGRLGSWFVIAAVAAAVGAFTKLVVQALALSMREHE